MAQLLWMVPLALVLTILLIRKFKKDARREYTRKIIRERLAGIRAENERFKKARQQTS